MSKWMCEECDWCGQESDLLRASNPFASNDNVVGCPHCKEINSMTMACDEPGCWRQVSCGTPTPGGYRNTCGKHKPPT
jgi:phage FluMu protein Com